jgi:hypothetical protein
MKVQSKVFRSNSQSWDAMCEEVSAFASEIGADRLINISMAAAGGTHLGFAAGRRDLSSGIGDDRSRVMRIGGLLDAPLKTTSDSVEGLD